MLCLEIENEVKAESKCYNLLRRLDYIKFSFSLHWFFCCFVCFWSVSLSILRSTLLQKSMASSSWSTRRNMPRSLNVNGWHVWRALLFIYRKSKSEFHSRGESSRSVLGKCLNDFNLGNAPHSSKRLHQASNVSKKSFVYFSRRTLACLAFS